VEKKDIEYFREFLQNRLEELLDHADGTVSGMIAPKGNFPDPADRASLETGRNFMLRIVAGLPNIVSSRSHQM
jgi:DnaK suppressor protein